MPHSSITAALLLFSLTLVAPSAASTDSDPYESINTTLLLIEQLDIAPGTRIVAWSEADRQIGHGAVEDERALVVIRGDHAATPDLVEGAYPDERVYLKVHPSGDQAPYPLTIQTIQEVLSGSTPETLRFQNDAVYKLTVSRLPSTFQLDENYPNPFRSTTTIRYTVSESSPITLEVFNALGQRVATLVDEHQPPGTYMVNLDASRLASGVYIYRLRAGRHRIHRRMLVVR